LNDIDDTAPPPPQSPTVPQPHSPTAPQGPGRGAQQGGLVEGLSRGAWQGPTALKGPQAVYVSSICSHDGDTGHSEDTTQLRLEDSLENVLCEIETHIDIAKNTMNALMGAIATAQDSKVRLDSENESLGVGNRQLMAENNELRTDKNELLAEDSALRSGRTDLLAETSHLSADNEKTREINEQLESACNTLRDAEDRCSDQLTSMQQNANVFKTQHENHVKQCMAQQNTMHETANSLQIQTDLLSSQAAEAQSVCVQLQEKRAVLDTEEIHLQKTLQMSRKAGDIATVELQELQQSVTTLRTTREDLLSVQDRDTTTRVAYHRQQLEQTDNMVKEVRVSGR